MRDGRSWRIGEAAQVAWIAENTPTGPTITSAIPPIFEAYATVVIPEDYEERDEHDRTLLRLLSECSAGQSWWLGYLDTGSDDVVFYDVPMVTLYAGWHYVIVEAGPDQAASWGDRSSWKGPFPDLLFPADHSWLVSTLWDDDWRCVGGSADLIGQLERDARLETRRVNVADDATPPGHEAH
jgi:hypothetical protein